MERGSKRDLKQLSMAIREINKKIRSERVCGGSSADPKKIDKSNPGCEKRTF